MKDIPWYEWLYAVTKDWRVWSYPKNVSRNMGWKFLSQWLHTRDWYLLVSLWKNKKWLSKKVHRLVWITYLENSWKKWDINHVNWIKTDNRVENLEWCTRKENIAHSINILGNKPKWPPKKSISQYEKHGKFIKNFLSSKQAAIETWIHPVSISQCLTWKTKTAGWFTWKYFNS